MAIAWGERYETENVSRAALVIAFYVILSQNLIMYNLNVYGCVS